MKSPMLSLSYGRTRSALEWTIFITVILVVMMGLSCFGGFGLSCKSSITILLCWGIWVAIATIALLVAAASLISDHPGE